MWLMPFSGRYAVTIAPPHMRGGWSLNRISMLFLLALLPPLGLALFEEGVALLPVLGLSILLTLAWNLVFARLQRQPLVLDWAVSAIAFALIVPLATPLWQIGLGLSFGIVVGEQIFGGHGRNFLNPVVVALAFLMFSFPVTGDVPRGNLFAIAVMPGTILLLVTGLISWRVLLGVAVGLACVIGLASTSDPLANLMMGPLAFALVFFACDPVSAASTNPGRWVYGLLSGLLIGLFGLSGEVIGSPTTIIFAILLASIFAPLIDYFVIALNAAHRRRRHG